MSAHPIFLSDIESLDEHREERQCNNCGEVWICDGNDVCRFCGSDDTQPVEDDEEEA